MSEADDLFYKLTNYRHFFSEESGDLNDLERFFNYVSVNLETNTNKFTEDIMHKALEEALEMSHGGISLAESARQDYLYARRHGPLGLTAPLPINFQKGDFYGAWRISHNGAGRFSLINDSPEAEFFKGRISSVNSRMVRRPIIQYLKNYIKSLLYTQGIKDISEADNESAD